jgi:hypothetical protein
MIARGAIKHLDIERSRDRHAGLPILGTEAARVLTPDRARAARHETRKERADRWPSSAEDRAATDVSPRSDGGGRAAKDTTAGTPARDRDPERAPRQPDDVRAVTPANAQRDGGLAPANAHRGRIPPDDPR